VVARPVWRYFYDRWAIVISLALTLAAIVLTVVRG
jgi:hypothetical protein